MKPHYFNKTFYSDYLHQTNLECLALLLDFWLSEELAVPRLRLRFVPVQLIFSRLFSRFQTTYQLQIACFGR
jgi:hypothetical protein